MATGKPIRKILITAGPTREKLDPVRFISNLSTGEMGYALAVAAREQGYAVTLISGPVALAQPAGIRLISIESAKELAQACRKEFFRHDALIMTAAVCDYRPIQVKASKIRRGGKLRIDLRPTEDIVAGLASRKGDRLVIGFCLETQDWLRRAAQKCRRKNLDGIVANELTPKHIPFGSRRVQIALIPAGESAVVLKKTGKSVLAKKILKWMETLAKKRYRQD